MRLARFLVLPSDASIMSSSSLQLAELSMESLLIVLSIAVRLLFLGNTWKDELYAGLFDFERAPGGGLSFGL